MKQIIKAIIDTCWVGGIMLAFSFSQKVPIYNVLIPIGAVALYNFLKATFAIYSEKKSLIN